MSRSRPCRPAAAVAAALALATPATAAAATPAQIEAAARSGGQWIAGQVQPDGSLPGFNSDWAIVTLAAAGVHPADVRAGASDPSAQDRLFASIASDDYRLATLPPWTVAGTIGKAALLAHSAGIRPTRVAPDVNLAAALATKWDAASGTFDPPQVNSDGFALLAAPLLDMPRGVREKVVALVRASQHDDGGWTFIAGGNLSSPGDVDMTGAALAMLCEEGATAADGQVAGGLAFLKAKQDAATGGIVAGPFVPPLNSPSNAWALIGLNACGVDPDAPAWLSGGGRSITDFLLSLQRPDGNFNYVPEDDDAGAPNDMNATEASARALSGAIFSADPPARAQAGAPRRRPVDPVAAGTPVPVALGIDDRAGDVRYCGVTVPAGSTLDAVLAAAASASAPAGCVSDPRSAGGRVIAVNDKLARPGSGWLVSVAGGAMVPAGGQTIGAGDNVALELRAWSLTASAWSLDLGAQARDTIGSAQPVTFTATGDGLKPAKVATAGAAAHDFVVAADGCSQATLDEGDSCTVAVRLAPSATGARAATLVVSDAGGDAISAVELRGSGAAAPAGMPDPVGLQGAPGAPGRAGPAGPRGRRGRAAKVRCKVVRKRRVRCAVRYPSGRRAKGSARATLTRRGRVYATGRLERLRPKRRLRRATYSLHVGDAALRVRIG